MAHTRTYTISKQGHLGRHDMRNNATTTQRRVRNIYTRAKHKRNQPQRPNADTPNKKRAGAAQLCGRAWTQPHGPLRATTLGVGGRRRGQDVKKESPPDLECCRRGSWARKRKAPRAHASWRQSSDGGLVRDSRACAWPRTAYTWATIQTGAQPCEGQRASWESRHPFRPPEKDANGLLLI